MEVNILGTDYEIVHDASAVDYPYLQDCDGYCDFYARKIILAQFTKENGYEHGDLEFFGRKVLRHELVHAFLHESGMHEEAMNEQIVDWIAIQFPKLNKLFEQLEIKA